MYWSRRLDFQRGTTMVLFVKGHVLFTFRDIFIPTLILKLLILARKWVFCYSIHLENSGIQAAVNSSSNCSYPIHEFWIPLTLFLNAE